ncbi:hypothetical protein DFR50_106178 [Roseiarcus fermentans]|uniref:Uncharacterized protein n=1 Tax=Roseiarcus fermentans TaxID=1473586 RepID=A0A366FQ07_9HYPH|nr:hypothetical protein [Roseiarcus fermentans]RBP16216.1 hypothetical protein DFR50_106178 [Roseiarcus fermentans]
MKRDDLLEAIDLLDQLAHVTFMATRGTIHEVRAREISDRIGKFSQRVGADGAGRMMERASEPDAVEFPWKL